MGIASYLIHIATFMGAIVNNKQLYSNIPRIILNSNVPSFQEVLFSVLDNVIVILSLFIVLRVLVPSVMTMDGIVFWFMISSFILIPTVSAVIFYSIRQAYPEGKADDGIIMPSLFLIVASLPILFLVYIAWPLTAITGLSAGILYSLIWLFVSVPSVFGLVSVSKSVAPVFVLLLGPGIIPHLANQSFFEFCS